MVADHRTSRVIVQTVLYRHGEHIEYGAPRSTTFGAKTTASPSALEDTEGYVEQKKAAFRAVGRDDIAELAKALEDVEVQIWLTWLNGAGDTLLKMADTRKRDEALHWLRKKKQSDLIMRVLIDLLRYV